MDSKGGGMLRRTSLDLVRQASFASPSYRPAMAGELFDNAIPKPPPKAGKPKRKSARPVDRPVMPPVHGTKVAKIVQPTPLDRSFDYLIPEELESAVRRGMRARVPLGRRSLVGYVIGVTDTSEVPFSKLRAIEELPDSEPIVNEDMLQLTEWMSKHYACSWGEALQAVIPAVIRRGKALRTVGVLRLVKSPEETLAHAEAMEDRAGDSPNSILLKQAKVLRTVVNFPEESWRPVVLAEKLGFTVSPIRTLEKAGWLSVEQVPIEDEAPGVVMQAEAPGPMNADQEKAVATVAAKIDRDEYATFLLHGITGSGKTEVYVQVLQHALAAGKSAIVLVPEISLTPQTVQRFAERLAPDQGLAILHSAMTDRDRRKAWARITSGEARVVIGPRSAVFAPVRDLGVIVVDEEHEPSYKQDQTPRYHARDVAISRCYRDGAVCILGSATPSLESAYYARRGTYQLVELRRRIGDRRLPSVVVVDMSEECRIQNRLATISGRLRDELERTLKEGQQAVMYLNRRGYWAIWQCSDCKNLLMCPNCDVPMHHHRSHGGAVCHYCYEMIKHPDRCPTCNSRSLAPKGLGTERLEEMIKQMFPGATVGRMDSDVMKSREDYEDVLGRFRDGEIDVLVGTQMIAKGLDFPNVTLVGVVNADIGTHMGDFRAQERTFQLLTQVAGRAGRGDSPGRVVVQTFSPEHPCIRLAQAQDYWGFYAHEMKQREIAQYPPLVRLLVITIEAKDAAKGLQSAKDLEARVSDWGKRNPGSLIRALGPVPAQVAKLRGRERWHVLAKIANFEAAGRLANELKGEVRLSESFRVTIDTDPYGLV